MSTRIVTAQSEHATAIGTIIYDMLDLFLAGSTSTAKTDFFNNYLSAKAIKSYLTDTQHARHIACTSGLAAQR